MYYLLIGIWIGFSVGLAVGIVYVVDCWDKAEAKAQKAKIDRILNRCQH